ncbi:MAG TPA: hypothetical protein ENI19_00875 [Candidatus Nealsonbacteria bacterium]|nr:hypothetical protein [Candidatus Nealsonbacteria bacterium]HEB46245.1 hypothetical protein [Candidatus Nealsonbacteria bacterium]
MENFKETIDRLSKTKYQERGNGIKAIAEYIEKKEGKEAVSKIEEKLAQYGYPVILKEIRALGWYPVALTAALLFAISETLNWGEKEMKEMGQVEPKMSFLVKYLAKYIISIKRLYQAATIFWKKTYNFGKLETIELNQKEKYGILRIKDFNIHPFFCRYLEGYFETISGFVLRGVKKIWCQEVKCNFQGDSFHEFIIRWE